MWLTACSHSPLRFPGCHHTTVSVWARSVWHVCLFQHRLPGPNLKNGTVCLRDGFAWPGAQGEQCRKATSESTTAPWTEEFWMRQLGPTNQQFHGEYGFMGILPAVFSNRALCSGAFMCMFLQLPRMPLFQVYLGTEGISLLVNLSQLRPAKCPWARQLLPAGQGEPAAIISCLYPCSHSGENEMLSVKKTSNHNSSTVLFFWLSFPLLNRTSFKR